MGIKLFIQVLTVQFLLTTNCNSDQQEKADSKNMPKVIYKGEIIQAEPKIIEGLVLEIELLLKNCEDFYELIVSDKVINEIKSDKQYLEISFADKQIIETTRFKTLEFDRLLIPLSGKFQSDGLITFFSGFSDYSNTPLINGQGKDKLDAALKKLLIK